MKDALFAQPKGEAWLVATGALTNIAQLVVEYPEVVEQIKGLSIMGGALGLDCKVQDLNASQATNEPIGNITPWAEFNIYVWILLGFNQRFCRINKAL